MSTEAEDIYRKDEWRRRVTRCMKMKVYVKMCGKESEELVVKMRKSAK
jgi:uncharacterized protein (DUF1919 family)